MQKDYINDLLAVGVVLEVVVLVGETESALVHLDDVPGGVLVVLRHHPREEAARLKSNSTSVISQVVAYTVFIRYCDYLGKKAK